MKKHKGKTKRWLAGILSAVLVIGSINLVDALEGSNGESALYDAPELTITQGATDYDLMKDITYDSSLYELAVVNDGGFDVNTVGDYEVTYSLTSKDDGTLDPGDSGNGEVKDPDDTKDPTDTEDSKNENGSSGSGDASNSDNENKDQNSGDNQGGDNTQTGDNSDNAGSDNGSDSSDSSNAGDSADAGQGDTNSDSSNAEDTADADETDSTDDTKDSQNTENENSADADTVNITEEQTPKAANIGVLGVSRPRTAVDMSYQSEPVGAEAVDVTKGDDTNTVDTQEKQVITFTRTVHVVAASEDEEPVYVARELVLIQGEEDYDLTDDILYDDVKYTLEVVELGGFDINVIGNYEISYALTEKENSVEDTGTLPEGNDSVDGADGADGADISEPDNAEETADADTVNITEEQTPKAANASQKVINFSRTVKVVAAVEIYPVNYGVATYANTQGNYTVNLGTPVWTDDTHTKFQYTNAKINTDGDGISLMTITLSNGKLPDDILNDATIMDVQGKSATWILADKESSQDIEKKIQNMTFNYVPNMNIYVTVNANDNEGFNNINNMKLTQWSENGHYYLYIPEQLSWSKTYNRALEFKLAGQQGYLATTTSKEELGYLVNLNSTKTWVAGTRLVRADETLLNNDKIEPLGSGVLKYRNNIHTSDVNVSRTHYYWAAGPESGQTIENFMWNSGEPNQGDYFTYGWTVTDMTLSDVQRYESCVMVLTDVKTLNDYCEGNFNDDPVRGFFVEFGGYAEGADPGQPDNAKKGETNVLVEPRDAEAKIDGVKYAYLVDALDTAEANQTIELLKSSGLTPVSNELLYNTSSIKEMNGNTVHADTNGTNIDVSDTGVITLRSGVVTVSNTDANERKIAVDGYVLRSTADYTVKAVDTNNNTTLGDSKVSVTLKAIGDTFTAVKNGATYTYTATKDNQTFYLGEYSAVLNWDERSGVAALASIGSPEFPAELVKPQTQPNNPYHQLTLYTVTIKPREDYSIDVDKVWVSMGVDAQGEPQMLDASEFVKSKDPNTGIITVTVKKPVDGDLIYYVGKVNGGSSSGSTVTHDRTTIQVTSAAGSAVTIPEFTATYFDEQKSKDITVSSQNGKVEVFKNVEVTLKFPAMNTSDPNPTEGALGITEDETFDILTKLAETGNATDLKAGFEWTDKSYTYKFTSTSASYNLEASYEKSHVVHIHVSGGSMDASTIPADLEANKQSLSNIRIIVPDQMTLNNLKFSPDGSLQNPSFTAKWLSHDNKKDLGTVNFRENAGSWKGSTLAVTQPSYLNVSFVAGNMLTVRIKGGTLDTAYGTPVRNWITKAAASSGFDHEYQLVVPENDQTVHFKINVEGSNILKSILANTKDVTSKVEAVKDQNNRIIAYTNGDAGSTIGEATTIDVTLVPSYTVTFWNKEVSPEKKIGTEMVMEGGKLDKAAYEKMAAGAVLPGYQFMAWKDTAGKVYTDQVVISADTDLHAVFREKVNISQNGNIIAANDFKIHLNSIKKGAFNTSEAVKRAKAEAYDANGKDVTNLISVEGLNAVQREGTFPLTFKYGDASITVNVTVTNAIPVVTGKTAYTLTFEGVPNGAAEYKVYSMLGAAVAGAKIEETANGIYRITGLEKGTEYKIEGDVLGSTTGKTALVDAEDIAKQFEDKQGDTSTNGKKGKDEMAENPNVKVVVDDEGNYKVIVKKNIDHSVEIPDTWGDVKVDLGGNSINGNDADAANSAKPGLIFKKDSGNDHPGTNLVITNGTIQGGNGSAAHPDGAAGIETATPDRPADAKITVGADAKVQGGNGADAGDSTGADAANGGNGGAGIEGEITPTIDGGTVTGGNGGKGGSSDTGAPGNGGNGGAGIKTNHKNVTVKEGTVTGGSAGDGGNVTGENNTASGGDGGKGGAGIDSGRADIVIGPGNTDVQGGAGGNGGNSNKGNGGNGGSGGSGAEAGKIDNDRGTIAGGNGGSGGNSSNGGHNGNGGNGGSGTKGNHTSTNGGTSSDGSKGQDGQSYVAVLFENRNGNSLNAGKPVQIVLNGKIDQVTFDKMQQEADQSKKDNEVFFAWVDKNNDTQAYTTETEVTASVTLVPVYRADSHIKEDADKNTIAADDFIIRKDDAASLTANEAKTRANVRAYDKTGKDITDTVIVDQGKLDALKNQTAGTYTDALSFQIPNGITASVTVEITDDSPVIIGKTAHTLTFTGRANTQYSVQKKNSTGGVAPTFTTDANGKATATGLEKATEYQISHIYFGSADGKTALVDAKDIAKQFEDRGAGDTTGNNATDRTEKAENSNVQVVVDDDGNYKVIVKKDIDHTVEIPDTWGEVKIDLGGHTITGDKADDNNTAKPGLDFVKDGSINEHPGTKLEIVNGTIKGGDGSAKHPDGAPGIGTTGDAADAGIIIGSNANVIGGNGADGTEGKDGGNGGAGIDGNGKITPTVNGTVTGGNGGKGGDSATGIPGNGGNGGNGISADDKTITINSGGTVKGGDAGSGGNATGDNTNPGGNGGNGGTGTETTQPGKTDNNGGTTSGGNGGDGGTSNNGNGGNGGNGGSGSTGENNNNGGTSSGGNGGNGGDSNNGTGGNGGNGGSSGETGGNGGNNSGGNGGNGGDSNSGNGGSGGNGGDSNSGTGGNGGNGGDSNNGTGGNGGNGGGSNSGNGGNGGNGGGSNSGNGGNGGNGGDSNSGNNGNGGSSGSNGNRPGGNGGGSNNGNGGNGGNNGGDNSGNNSGDNGGNNGGDNSNTNGNNNSGSTGNTGNTPDAGNTAGNDSGNNAHKGNKGNSTGNSNAGQKDPAEDDSLNDAADESSLTGDADGSDADGSDADGIQEEESIHADSDSVENGTDSDSHIPFGECGFHWIPIVWLLVILGYTVVRVKKLRDESEEA